MTTFSQVESIKHALRELRAYVRKYEEDEAYKEYCEGIIDAAISVLGVIRP